MNFDRTWPEELSSLKDEQQLHGLLIEFGEVYKNVTFAGHFASEMVKGNAYNAVDDVMFWIADFSLPIRQELYDLIVRVASNWGIDPAEYELEDQIVNGN